VDGQFVGAGIVDCHNSTPGKRHTHKLANERGTGIQNRARNDVRNALSEGDQAIA
jgi:hypothetical protein